MLSSKQTSTRTSPHAQDSSFDPKAICKNNSFRIYIYWKYLGVCTRALVFLAHLNARERTLIFLVHWTSQQLFKCIPEYWAIAMQISEIVGFCLLQEGILSPSRVLNIQFYFFFFCFSRSRTSIKRALKFSNAFIPLSVRSAGKFET